MLRSTALALLLSCSSLAAMGQAPALDTFISTDGAFQFLYPQTYDLLIGERMLKATQGRNSAIPVCDFATALACVIYPFEDVDDPTFEAAGFSVRTVAETTDESECLSYADQSERRQSSHLQLASMTINGHSFRHASFKKKVSGHSQTADFYRTFEHQKCYELQIDVSIADSDEPGVLRPAASISAVNAKVDKARDSLRLILSSVVFPQ